MGDTTVLLSTIIGRTSDVPQPLTSPKPPVPQPIPTTTENELQCLPQKSKNAHLNAKISKPRLKELATARKLPLNGPARENPRKKTVAFNMTTPLSQTWVGMHTKKANTGLDDKRTNHVNTIAQKSNTETTVASRTDEKDVGRISKIETNVEETRQELKKITEGYDDMKSTMKQLTETLHAVVNNLSQERVGTSDDRTAFPQPKGFDKEEQKLLNDLKFAVKRNPQLKNAVVDILDLQLPLTPRRSPTEEWNQESSSGTFMKQRVMFGITESYKPTPFGGTEPVSTRTANYVQTVFGNSDVGSPHSVYQSGASVSYHPTRRGSAARPKHSFGDRIGRRGDYSPDNSTRYQDYSSEDYSTPRNNTMTIVEVSDDEQDSPLSNSNGGGARNGRNEQYAPRYAMEPDDRKQRTAERVERYREKVRHGNAPC